MAKVKYYYDPETCDYQPIKYSKKEKLKRTMIYLLSATALAIASIFAYNSLFVSPFENQLIEENQALTFQYRVLDKKIQGFDEQLNKIQETDDQLFRVFFELPAVDPDIRNAGQGGSVRNPDLVAKKLESGDFIGNYLSKVDRLSDRAYIQLDSFEELEVLATQKNKMLASIPSILPISFEEQKRISSKFGMRFHPILKRRRMHPGIDIAAKKNTPVYAPGDGVIDKSGYTTGGYGNLVTIDHGFGYRTKYGHLNSIVVAKGQNIKRGELIGYVGTTGTSTSDHLHYEVLKDGRLMNPLNYFFDDIDQDEYEQILELALVKSPQ